eukprot:3457329-Pleurochrysis_carterae.AAC.2
MHALRKPPSRLCLTKPSRCDLHAISTPAVRQIAWPDANGDYTQPHSGCRANQGVSWHTFRGVTRGRRSRDLAGALPSHASSGIFENAEAI